MKKDLIKLVNKIEKAANDFTDWGFTTQPSGSGYLIGVTLTSETKDNLNVIYDIQETDSSLVVFMPGCIYDEGFLQKELAMLGFPIKVSARSGEMLMIRSEFKTANLEKEIDVVVQGMMIEMMNAVNRIYTNSKAN